MASNPDASTHPNGARSGNGEGRPTVALVLPAFVADQMFGEADLTRLRDVADVAGPFAAEDFFALRAALGRARAVITGWSSPRLDDVLLRAAPNLELIAHSAGSVKGVVSDASYDRGVRVTTAASANAAPVAQFTVSMMVSLLKQVPWISAAYARGDLEEVQRRRLLVRELNGLSVGLISASRVGRAVIERLRDYPRVRARVYDPHLTDAGAAALGVERSSLEDACRCDVVSVHAPSLPETRHMLNAQTLSLMPDHAVFINTARGALVDEGALVAEVRRRPLYVLLDVTDPEPPAADSPLRAEPNILLTPHIAGAMSGARKEMGQTAIDETLRFLRGEPLQHEVTREMLPTQA